MKSINKLNRIIDFCDKSIEISANDHIGNFSSLQEWIDIINSLPDYHFHINQDLTDRLLEAGTIYSFSIGGLDRKPDFEAHGINFSEVIDKAYIYLFPEETFIPSDESLTVFDLLAKRCKFDVMLEVNSHKSDNLTIEEYIEEINSISPSPPEIEAELSKEIIEANRIISLQMYPDGSVGSYMIYGSDLEEILFACHECLDSHEIKYKRR